jgi:hypothetical protein
MKEKNMTKAKSKSEFYKDTTIPNTLLDELMNPLPAMPTQEDLFGPEGVIKQLSAALPPSGIIYASGLREEPASRRGPPQSPQWARPQNA